MIFFDKKFRPGHRHLGGQEKPGRTYTKGVHTYRRDCVAKDIVLVTLFGQRFSKSDLCEFGSYSSQKKGVIRSKIREECD